MAVYLRGTFKRCDLSLVVFSLFYALCAFILGFYWNIMWLDTFALLPLVILGVQSLVKEGKYRLFIASLALSIYSNYFFSIYTCIFVAITFFSQCIIQKFSLKESMKKLGLIAVYSAIAIGISALLLLPAFINLQNTINITKDSFPTRIRTYHPFSDVLGNLIAFTIPTRLSDLDLPNLYSGMLTVLLAPVFFYSKKIKQREKVVFGVVAAIILISCNFEALNYIWNGFYYTVGIPYRYSYLFSFTLIIMAYRAFTVIEQTEIMDSDSVRKILLYFLFISAAAALGLIITELRTVQSILVVCIAVVCGYYLAGYFIFTKNIAEKRELKQILLSILFMTAPAVLILIMAGNGPQENKYVVGSAVLCGVYIVALFMYLRGTQKLRKTALAICVAAVLIEVSVTAYIGVDTVGLTDRNEFPDKYDQVQQLLSMRESSDPDFYRTEFYNNFVSNDPHLYNYDGVTFYSSTANDSLTNYLTSLGISGRVGGKRYVYSQPSPLIDAFVGLRYLVARDSKTAEYEFFWEPAAEVGESLLLENNYYLPVGFMVDNDITGYTPGIIEPEGRDPFGNQNELFRRATGLERDLFTFVDTKVERHEKYNTRLVSSPDGGYEFLRFLKEIPDDSIGHLRWDYRIPADGMYYAYFLNSNFTHVFSIFINGQPAKTMSLLRMSVFPVGFLNEGDVLSLFNPLSSHAGSINMSVARIDEALFVEGYNLLASETLELTEFTDTKIKGSITTSKDGLLYTSIPYNANWRAYVNGAETEIVPIGDAMSALQLSPGAYEIVFRYTNRHFTAGIIISVISIAVFAALILKDRYRSKKATG